MNVTVGLGGPGDSTGVPSGNMTDVPGNVTEADPIVPLEVQVRSVLFMHSSPCPRPNFSPGP